MKNNALWYLSPIAFALLFATWISQGNLNNGTFDQTFASRTIQSVPATTPDGAHCIPGQVSMQSAHELDENVTASAHPMRVAAKAQCPKS